MTGPRPYQPPDLNPARPRMAGEPKLEKSRPWLALRDGETLRQWQRRVSHSCWRCGHYEPYLTDLDRHELEHE
jgi:hypothetical protein